MGRRIVDRLPGAEQMTSRFGPLVDHEHPRAGPACRMRRRESARAGADHEHVAVRVRLVVAVGIRPGRSASEPRRAPDEVLVLHPPRRRPHEGLVVEPGGNQWAEHAVHGPHVEFQVRPAVLARRPKAIVDLDLRRPCIRLPRSAGSELDERVGLLGTIGDHSAGAVILEAAPEQAHAVGEKRGGECVTGEARVPFVVEREVHRLCAIDSSPGGKTEVPVRHRPVPDEVDARGGFSPMRYTAVISWVTVSRSTLNHRPQPAA